MRVWRAMLTALTLGFMISCVVQAADSEENLRVGSATIHIQFADNLTLPHPVLVEWVRRAAVAVTNYLGRFPVQDLEIRLKRGGRDTVNDGVTHGAHSIEVRLGRHGKADDLTKDWILTHEMFHLAFPTLDDQYRWMMEGLSDYLEPIARGRVGQLTPAEVWREFAENFPQGLPAKGDQGLDHTFTRERIYWGGNIFWLLADVRIREKTHNKHSVDDAIRAILDEGGNGDAEWPIERVLKIGDKATHTSVLVDLHKELGLKPGTVDLNDLWRRLGVKYDKGAVTFGDSAPDAAIRIAIITGRVPAS